MKTATDLLVDISSNMEGNKKIFAQRLVKEELIPMLDFSAVTGLTTFMAAGTIPLVIRSLDLGKNTRADFETKINNLPMPNQNAPIAETIKESIKDFGKVQADKKRMIMVTAGVENCAATYQNAAHEAADKGIQLNMVLVGATAADKAMAQRAVAESKGALSCIDDDVYDSAKVHAELQQFVAVLNGQPFVAQEQPSAPKPQPVAQPQQTVAQPQPVQPVAPVVPKPIAEPVEEVAAMTKSEPITAKFEPINPIEAEMETEQKKKEPSTDELANVLHVNNDKVTKLLQNSIDAFMQLAGQKANALAEIDRLKDEERQVIIHTNAKLEKEIAEKSQKLLFEHLQKKYPNRVKWMHEKGANQDCGYDFEIIEPDNNSVEYFIACKGLLDNASTFYMTGDEWKSCTANNRNYQVYLVRNLQASPALTIIDSLMGWVNKGWVLPCSDRNIKLAAHKVVLSIVK